MARRELAADVAELAGKGGLRSINSLNQLPLEVKERVYRQLIPDRIFSLLGIDDESFLNPEGERVVDFVAPRQGGFAIIEVRRRRADEDCAFFLEVADTPLGKVEVTFLVVNDPEGPRFAIDRDEEGRRTKFGTVRRNLSEEERAMRAGLAPGQVRRGLRVMSPFISRAVSFFSQLGQDMFVVEPMGYHNAIAFERRGFGYIRGLKKMTRINEGFARGGDLYRKLDGSSPFRRPELARTVRGRSWAIHDGILDEPWRDVEMYLPFSRPLKVDTFPFGAY